MTRTARVAPRRAARAPRTQRSRTRDANTQTRAPSRVYLGHALDGDGLHHDWRSRVVVGRRHLRDRLDHVVTVGDVTEDRVLRLAAGEPVYSGRRDELMRVRACHSG
eukprot:4842538-Prymnesium_polylepis.1